MLIAKSHFLISFWLLYQVKETHVCFSGLILRATITYIAENDNARYYVNASGNTLCVLCVSIAPVRMPMLTLVHQQNAYVLRMNHGTMEECGMF